MNKCRDCDSNLDEFNISSSWPEYCRACYNYYKSNRYKDPKYKAKHSARKKAYDALKAGKIFKFNCAICDSDKSQMHHPDYSKPLDVYWLCKKCHTELHVLERRAYASVAA